MQTETENNADIKFEAEKFNEACAMYSEALQGIDESQSKKKIELLQKLGDSQQGAGRFKESLATYELLLKAQLEGDCREVEKIVTYLRLSLIHI